MDDLSQFKATYITECFELLEEMEEQLLNLDEGSQDNEALNAIFRCAHSIKGGAGAFNLQHIASFTHLLETLLDKVREGEIVPCRTIIDVLLKARDIVFSMVCAAQENQEPEEGLGNEIAQQLELFIKQGGGGVAVVPSSDAVSLASVGKARYQIHFAPGPMLMVNGNEPILLLRELRQLGEADIVCDYSAVPTIDKLQPDICYMRWDISLITEASEADIREVFEFVEGECVLTVERQEDEEDKIGDVVAIAENTVAGMGPQATAAAPVSASIRVDIDKVDTLINMVGEIVITQAMLSAQSRQLPPQQYMDLINGIEELSQHTRELQEAVMAVRMQPVKSIFARMPRLVRDLADKLGKQVVLTLRGENTEVDKTIIEQLSDPLTHLIRNAVDHGVETPQERKKAGKTEQGEVILSAEHRGGRIVIEIKDNGKGIDRDRVLAKAKEKGLVKEGDQLSESDIDHLIFAPGFSTAQVVSDVSGRGVGMDVVKRNIESLGGTVHLGSVSGEGSVFTITLPLTLAILDGMIVRIGQEHYIIPIAHILESLRPSKEHVRPVAGGMHVLQVRGEFVPLVFLNHLFGIEGAQCDASKALVVLVENAKEQVGLVVDELIGQQQVVIKSLEENADPIEGISGATILGDGKVSLILDIAGVCRLTPAVSKFQANAA